MRIISKFKDYYDGAAGYGVDTTVVYERNARVLPSQSVDVDQLANVQQHRDIRQACEAAIHSDRFRTFERLEDYNTIFVGIAGKIYIGLALHYDPADSEPEMWKRLKFDEPFAQMYVWKPENLTEKQLNTKTRYSHWGISATEVSTLRDWFEFNKDVRVVENIELFTKHNMVSFVAVRARNGMDIEVNSQLSKVNFQRMVDGFTAFQEISMFVTGVLAQKDQMTHVATDKELLFARGHDDKSFKTPPTKRR